MKNFEEIKKELKEAKEKQKNIEKKVPKIKVQLDHNDSDALFGDITNLKISNSFVVSLETQQVYYFKGGLNVDVRF